MINVIAYHVCYCNLIVITFIIISYYTLDAGLVDRQHRRDGRGELRDGDPAVAVPVDEAPNNTHDTSIS